MKIKIPTRLLESRAVALLLAFALSTLPAWSPSALAQPVKAGTAERKPVTPAPEVTRSAGENGTGVTKLSPFVVHPSENDSGYYAENTLAGSRLNTNIGDLAASITVVTRQQMLDTGSLDLNDVFLYEANTEGTGNYTSFTFDDQGGVRDNNQGAPESANRVRGVGSVTQARNYYASLPGLAFDVYNTESVEISRGPNSLLFGLGSAAGTVNQSSASANLQRNTNEVALRYGTEDAYRASFKFNRALIPGKLGIIAAGLYDSRGFTRKPSYDISRRAYVATTARPFRKTSLRASYEHFNADSRLPNTVTPQDGITEWRTLGSPTWNPLTGTLTRNGVASTLPNSNVTNVPGLQNRFSSLPAMYYDDGGPRLWMQQGLTAGAVNNAYPTTLPQSVYSATTIMKLFGTTLPLFRPLPITNRSLYDWSRINVTSGTWAKRDANVYNIELIQELLPDLFLQAGWYREDFKTKNFSYNANQPVEIDVNTVLMDGTANPYLGKPFFSFSGNSQPTFKINTNDNFRVGLAYALNFTKKSNWLKWLGSHQLFAIGDRRELSTDALTYSLTVLDNHPWQNSAGRFAGAPGQITIGSTIIPRVYLGGNDGVIRYGSGFTNLLDNFTYPLRHAILTNGSYAWQNEPALLGPALTRNSNRAHQLTDSITTGVQSSLLGGRIVPTLGFRRDKNESKANVTLPIDPATGLLIPDGLNSFGPTQVLYGNTRTAGVVVKPFKGFSLTYGQSRNFSPAAYRVDIFGNALPLPTGKGKDYGVRFALKENRLVFGVNFFETSAANARGTQADGFMFRVSRFESGFITWATTAAQNQLGAGASSTAVANRVAEITQLPVNFVPPALATIGSTSTVSARGLEAQLIFNPGKSWNLKATLGKQKTVYAHVAPEFETYSNPRMPVWLAAKDSAGVPFWTNPAVPDLGIPVNFWVQNISTPMSLAKALEGKRTQGQREWQANLIGTYRVVEGRLKGATMGGGVRWQDDAIIGYLGGPAGTDGVIRSLDVNKPAFDHLNPAVDFWVSKNFILPQWFGRKQEARVQLNVRNAFEKGNWLQPISVNPDGLPSGYRIVEPRQWYLTTTFIF